MAAAPSGKMRIGVSGWSYPDWRGIVYPRSRERGFRPLTHLARWFNAVEVNSSFYATPLARVTAGWLGQTPDDFRFAFKLTQTFTHRRSEFPAGREVSAFREGLRPIREAGRLGPLLMQFPWSFRKTAENVDWLRRLKDAFEDFERFVEVRHTTWLDADGLARLREVGGFCNIDQPALGACIGPTAISWNRSAYVRLHGRNAAKWFSDDQPAFERYNYLYDGVELREWLPRFESLRAQAAEVYVFANNHYRGQAVVNALELRALLDQRRFEIPPELLASYPRLEQIALPPRQSTLFDA